jgi:hypothetical protein
MKISWGTKIAALYIGFVVMIIGLVAATFRQPSQLVTKDYYEQESNFNQHLQAQQAAAELSAPVEIKMNEQAIELQFPHEFENEQVKGEAYFYSVSNAGLDRRIPFDIAKDCHWQLSRSELTAGKYELQIQWTVAGTSYFQSKNLQLN